VDTLAGALGAPGAADSPAPRLSSPHSVALVGDSIFVSDRGNHRVRAVSGGGVVTTVAGSGIAAWADGVGWAAAFNSPAGVAAAPGGAALLYVADTSNNRVRALAAGSGATTTLAGGASAGWADGAGTVTPPGHWNVIARDLATLMTRPDSAADMSGEEVAFLMHVITHSPAP
jgi:hypothetical protein